MFEQNRFNTVTLEAAYQTLNAIKNTPLTLEQFHDNIRCITGADMEVFLNTDTPESVIMWYYGKFHDTRIKSMLFTIENGMWTYQEYEKLGLSAMRGMGACKCCGRMTNVVTHGLSQDWVCSSNCLNNLREKGNQ